MDIRELELARIAVQEMKTQNRSGLDVLNNLIAKDLELFKDNPYFKDDKAFPGSTDQMTNASTFVMRLWSGSQEEKDYEYNKYKDFFDDIFSKAKKDIISNEFLSDDSGTWQPVLNWIDSVKSYANGKNLKPKDVSMHLDRYIKTKKPELLIDVPTWDGVDRIKDLGQFITLKGHSYEIFEDAIKEWLANIFRRLYLDGAQNRCIILKGSQGLGKDNLVRNLLGAFGCYYSKFTNSKDERAIWDQVTGSLVLHIEEFDQTGSMGVSFLKDIITRDQVTYRSSYARRNSTRKCHASFISTVNIDAVLRDETGNRRFAVFEIEKIDWSYPKNISDQILAQAYALYKDGYKAKKETWELIKGTNSQFEQVDLVPELLNMWDIRVSRLTPDIIKTKEFRFETIQSVLNDMSKGSGWKQKTLLTMLKTNGRSRHTDAGTAYKFYPVKELEGKPDVSKPTEKTVFNHATKTYVSVKAISQSIDQDLTIGDDMPF